MSDRQPRLRRVSTAPSLPLMLDPIRWAKDPQRARVESVPLEEMGGRGRRRDRLERDKGRRSVTAGGLSSLRRRSQGRRSEVGDAIDFQVEGADEVAATLGEEVDFEAFLRATNTLLFHSAMGPPSCQTDPLARRRPLPSSSAFLPPTIDTLSQPISPSSTLSSYPTPLSESSADEEDDSPSSFWSPEYQTARHIAQFGAGGNPSFAPSSSAPTTRVPSHLTRRPMRISYDVPEECEAWTLAQGIVEETLAAPRFSPLASSSEAAYRRSDEWKEEGSDLYAGRKEAVAKRLEMVAQQLAWA